MRIGKCEACKKEGLELFVAASVCGPVSFAYCKECLANGIEPYEAIVDYISCALSLRQVDDYRKYINESYLRLIDTNLKAHNKTEEQFKFDLKQSIMQFEEAMEEYFNSGE